MKIPYTLVSMAAILRDYDDPNYLNGDHYKLTSIADYLYNSADGAFSDHPEDNLLPEFKVLFDKYGADYFQKVLDDMYALDGQLTSNTKVQELIDDYSDRFSSITASTKVTATKDNSYNQHLVQVSNEDKQYVLNYLNKSHKTVGMGGAGDLGYYVSEFEPAYGMYLWSSDTGLRILDDNGIEYTKVKKSVGASTKITASRWYYYEPMSEQELADLKADILALPGCDKLDMDTDDMEEIGYIMLLPGYNDIPLSDPQYYEKRKQLLKDILRVAKEHGLSRTEDRIEDYGSCWYIVLRTNKPKIDEYDEYDDVITSTKVTAATNSTGVITGPYDTSLHYDFWYGDKFVPRKYGADAFVSGNGEYHGNIFDDTGATIGDYYTDNSVLIEKNFLVDFGE